MGLKPGLQMRYGYFVLKTSDFSPKQRYHFTSFHVNCYAKVHRLHDILSLNHEPQLSETTTQSLQRNPLTATATMATTFHGFSRLPFELRHAVWEYLLPSAESELMQHYILSFANVILALPYDTIFGYGVYIYYDGTLIKDFMQDYPPPYAARRACPESRVVALKHV